jgi:hypothetical protein
VSRSDGATVKRAAKRVSGWLGLAGTIWAREKVSSEEAWLGVARDSEESRQLRERERAETE